MINIVVINCDDTYVEYEWNSMEDFIADMESDNENIPMLDDTLVEVNTDIENLNLWWRNTGYNKVYDLYEGCKRECNHEYFTKKGTVISPYWGFAVGEKIYVRESNLTLKPCVHLYKTEELSSFVTTTWDMEMLNECVRFE